MHRIIFGLAALLTFGTAAAQTQAPKPAVLVHADAGAVQVQGTPVAIDTSAGANVGDIVSVATGGRATVTYANGCVVHVPNGYQIPAEAPICNTAIVSPAKGNGMLAAGGIAAGVLVIASALSGGSDDKASSP